MIFDGRNSNMQMNRDLFVRQTFVDQSDDFHLTFCETSATEDWTAFDLTSERGNSIEGQTRDSRGAQRLPIHDGSDIADEIVKG